MREYESLGGGARSYNVKCAVRSARKRLRVSRKSRMARVISEESPIIIGSYH